MTSVVGRYGVYGEDGPSVSGTGPRGALAGSAVGAAQPACCSAFWNVFSLSTGLGMVQFLLTGANRPSHQERYCRGVGS
jgi:hypothetical protein